MKFIAPSDQLAEDWRPGVKTELKAAARLGAETLCVFEQHSEPGMGAPEHHHPEDEEVILVIEGHADFTFEGKTRRIDRDTAVIVPAGVRHSFVNVGEDTLRTVAIFAAPTPTVVYANSAGETLAIGANDPLAVSHRTHKPA